MTEHRQPVHTIAIEEVRLDAMDGGVAPEPADPRRGANRRRRVALLVGAVVGALAAGAATIAVWSPGHDDEAAPPTTTIAPGPIRATGRDDRRALLADVPIGFRVTAARETVAGQPQPPATAVLYAEAGASVDEGRWVLATISPAAARLPLDVGFRRPARSTIIGSTAGVVGRGSFGDETTAFDRDGLRITLIANDLPPGTTETLARHARVEDGDVHLLAGDLPSQLIPQPGWRFAPGLAIAGDLATDAGPPDGWSVSYGSDAGATIDVTASAIAPDEAPAVASISGFFLTDVTAAVIRGHGAVAGRAGDALWVVWTEGATLVTVSLTGVDLATGVRLAGSIHLGSDPGWDDAAWAAVAPLSARTPQAMGVAAGQQPDGDPTMRIVGRGPLRGATSWWDVTATIDGGEAVWALRTGHNAVSGDGAGRQHTTTLTPPLTLAAAGEQTFSLDPPGADAGEVSDWYAVAVVFGDASLEGAVLRLTTDGLTTSTTETTLAPVRGFDGYVIAALTLPWTDHYTAEVIAADGTVLASTTDSDAI